MDDGCEWLNGPVDPGQRGWGVQDGAADGMRQ